ncbi:MAG: hypothetical protein HFJ41_01220 [Clostridia bacterium]|nr:hypothetical protein [Clostridia bacterium]
MKNEEEWEYYKPFIEEAERDIEENGTISWEELKKELKKDRRRKLYIKRRNMQLRLANWLGDISKKFIRT